MPFALEVIECTANSYTIGSKSKRHYDDDYYEKRETKEFAKVKMMANAEDESSNAWLRLLQSSAKYNKKSHKTIGAKQK